jgi:hypothetical protein
MGNGESGRSKSAKRNTGLAVCLALGMGLSQNALAYDEPALNLGLTSFLDGGLPAGPGFYAVEYLQIYSADRLRNLKTPTPVSKTDVDAVVSLTQFAYLSKAKIGSASLGLDVIVPVVLSANADDGLGHTYLKGENGIGDVLIGPFLQFDPIMGKNGPLLIHRIEFQVLAPVGRYDRTAAVQPGSNFWSFNPYWAGTLFLAPEWTVSGRFHYLWNGKNDEPNAALGPTATSSRAGQAFHMNFATEYAVTKELRIGVNGYYLQQTTDTEVNDIAVAGRKERVVAIGPGFTYSWGPDQNFFFNAYKEFDAENRPEGERFVVRYVHHF